MKTVIFCGGQGSRIRDVAENVPKPMLPIGGKPILWHILSIYAAQGHTDFILCLGHLGWQVKEYFLNYSARTYDFKINLATPEHRIFLNNAQLLPWTIVFAETGEYTQTGSRLKKVTPYLEGDDTIMVTYGDGVANVDLKALIQFHHSHGKAGTITGVRPSGRYGEMTYDKNGLVTTFNEKPQTEKGRVNGGFMVFNAQKLLSYIPSGDEIPLEKQPLMDMCADGQLMTYRHDGFWQPMDTFREYKLLNDLWENGNAPWKIW